MKKLLFLCALILVSSTAFAEDQPSNTGEFDRLDQNHDGAVTKEEFFQTLPKMRQEAFDVMDENKDGRLDAKEWEHFRSNHGRMPGHGGGMMPPGGRMMPPGMSNSIPTPPPGQKMSAPDILPPTTK